MLEPLVLGAALKEKVPLEKMAYILECCPVCGDAIKAKVGEKFIDPRDGKLKDRVWAGRIIYPICKCEAKIRDEREAGHVDEERRLEILANRRRCFKDAKTASSTFNFDARRGSDVSKAARAYIEHFAELREKGQGLLLYGPVGVGKSFYAACVCNELLDRGYVCLFADMNQLIDMVDGEFQGKQERLDSLKDFDLIVIDDFGKERRGGYMDEQIIDIMDKIYENYIPLIVTTNLLPAEMISDSDLFYQRVYSRIIENCTPVKVEAQNQRYIAAQKNRQQMLDLVKAGAS